MTSDVRPRICFVFVCQQGELELQSLLLGLSLRRFLRFSADIVAAIPSPPEIWGTPDERTLDALRALGIRIEYVRNAIGKEYPIGNKLACLEIATDAERIAFLDSDIMAIAPLDFAAPLLSDRFLCGKPADLASVPGDIAFWEPVMRLFDLPSESEAVTASVTGQIMPPYFNAGFLNAKANSTFAEIWKDTAMTVRAAQVLPKRYDVHLDQVALTVALRRAAASFGYVSERWNFPAHLKPLDPARLPLLVHYHWGSVVRREPVLATLARELANQNAHLKELITATEGWSGLFRSSVRGAQRHGPGAASAAVGPMPDAFITGIPRSGTSFLCSAFHKIKDCVAINEPREIFGPFMNEGREWELATYYLDLRRDVGEGIAVTNKLVGKDVVSDTRLVDHRQSYRPTVSSERFVLMTKNTLAYLARIRMIRKVMPHARIFACVRNPFDTIKSWERSFQHLGDALVDEWPVGGTNDEALAGWQRRRLERIASHADPMLKRALLWKHLANLIIDSRHDLHIVRYEELVTDPEVVVARAYQTIDGGPPLAFTEPLGKSSPKAYAGELTDHERDIIAGVCYQAAYELGYDLQDW